MKNYKGTDRFMHCHGFQFELGKKYSIPDNESLNKCRTGFHSCDTLLEVTAFYPIRDSRYFEVDIEDTIKEPDKNCSRHITLVRELTFNEVMRMLNFNKDGSPLAMDQDQTNLGFYNNGNYNEGNYNDGSFNGGNHNDGDYNNGNHNNGNHNNGNDNIGGENNGSGNIGSGNIGNHNIGNYNIGNHNEGNHIHTS